MNAYRGGYQIIDLKNTAFTKGTAATVNGVYEAIEGNYHKPLLFSDFSLDGTEYNGTFADVSTDGTSYSVTLHGHTVTITDDDAITFAE